MEGVFDDDVHRFLLNQVDSVPQMEALLLLWETRPRRWTPDELCGRLYIDSETLEAMMGRLVQRRLLNTVDGGAAAYFYEPGSAERDRLLEAVCVGYRKNLVLATTIIHSKASLSVREFARAFKLRKDF